MDDNLSYPLLWISAYTMSEKQNKIKEIVYKLYDTVKISSNKINVIV